MAKFSTGLRQAMLEGPGVKAALDGGRLRIFCAASDPADADGTAVDPPATADAAETGTLMLELTVGGDGATGLNLVAENGVLRKQEGQVWMCANALHTGPLHYWRFVPASATTGESATEARIQGTVGLVLGDMLVTSLMVQQGTPWTLSHFDIDIPASGDAP